MIGDTLTFENLKGIERSMSKISEIDRSDYFNTYYKEVVERLGECLVNRLISAIKKGEKKIILELYDFVENWDNFTFITTDSLTIWDNLVDDANDILLN